MSNIKIKKIDDYQVKPGLITGGKQEEYWRTLEFKKELNKKFLKYRFPAFQFKQSIDYLDQEYICRKFKLKGLEFGNWVSNEERYNFLICGHIALEDLQKVLQLKNNLGFLYTLGIAFGARGSGSAAAHFEPGHFMINLTKKYGWSSLGHEYGHAIDYFYGGYIERSKDSFSLSYGSTTKAIVDISNMKKDSLRYLINDLINSINTVTINNKKQHSDYYKILLTKFKNNEYWFRRTEIFARFFEKYLQYRLSKLGIKNNFLTKDKYVASAYITKNDFKRVLPKMNKFIEALRVI